MKYVVNEILRTFQGEGVHVGKACGFVRLQGCDQSCPWCDSAGTWHPKYKTDKPKMSAELVLNAVGNVPMLVVTGGEPTLWDLRELCNEAHKRGMKVHLETAGHHQIRGNVDWVTVSPKPFAAKPLPSVVGQADEFKIIVDSEQALHDGLACIEGRSPESVVWLHPEWSKRNDQAILNLITTVVIQGNGKYRAGWQMHKNYMADRLSPYGEKRLIPLGGNEELGY